jgi:putative transcriptional regulator
MEDIPYSHIQKGTFLIASPELESGLFFRSVILVCEHNPNGSFGLVINKKLDLELPEEIMTTENLNNPRVGMRTGGPIQTNQMMLVHTSDEIPQQTLELCEGVYLGGDLQFLHESIDDSNGPNVLLFFGYTGWTAGQLEREFLDGNWFLHPASAKHLFYTSPEKIWQTLLREMGGKYATLSLLPEDLSLN